jgi:hypothetical protein
VSTLRLIFRQVCSWGGVFLLPVVLLTKIFAQSFWERFTLDGKRERIARLELQAQERRLQKWTAREYPGFSLADCPADPDDERYEVLHQRWLADVRDIYDEFDAWESENGAYHCVDNSDTVNSEHVDRLYWKDYFQLSVGFCLLILYLLIVIGTSLWLVGVAAG